MRLNVRRGIPFALAALIIGIFAGSAAAQTGLNGDLLKQALSSGAGGDCPASIMSPLVVGACQMGMPAISQKLTALGNITDASFLGTQPTPQGPAEVYLVSFANGKMTWMIATGSDGKITILWSPNG